MMDDQWWLIWLGIALVAGVAEIFTLGLVFAMVGGGALVAAVVAGLTGSWILSTLAFAVSTGLLMVAVRPPLLRYSLTSGPPPPAGVAALVGRSAEVVAAVDRHGGQVKLAGEIWSARRDPADHADPADLADLADLALEVGSTVFVQRIDGATAVVSTRPPRSLPGGSLDTPALPGGDSPSDRPEN
jgi:membrane protein implicated in regulation of membrane protease activity